MTTQMKKAMKNFFIPLQWGNQQYNKVLEVVENNIYFFCFCPKLQESDAYCAALHGYWSAYFNDICMLFYGFFFVISYNFYSSISITSCDDYVTTHITHYYFIQFKHCKPASTAPSSNTKFGVWWHFSWLLECFKPCPVMILLWEKTSVNNWPKNISCAPVGTKKKTFTHPDIS